MIATGPDAVPEIERRGSRPGRSALISKRYRSAFEAAPLTSPKPTRSALVADGLAMFADPAIARARDLLDRATDCDRTWSCRRFMSWAGRTSQPVCMYCMGWERTTRTSSGSRPVPAHVRTTLGEPARDHRWPTPLRRSVPPTLQPPDDHPFTDVIAMQGAGQVCPGDVLPESVYALRAQTNRLSTLGTLFNGAADFDVPSRRYVNYWSTWW